MTATAERGSRAGGAHRHSSARRARPHQSYALFLVPGALAFLAVIVVPFLMNTGVSFTDWQGSAAPGGPGSPTTAS